MGVPKFFRWISERYPKIIERYGCRPVDSTVEEHFGESTVVPPSPPDPLSECGVPPQLDRLYIDMNGIIHGCSHNNSDNPDDLEEGGVARISEAEIFQNVCYYLERVVKDIAKPQELVYLAIDGVAPRAKLNQQRARRYRAGKEGEIEQTVYQAHRQALLEREQQQQKKEEDSSAFEQQTSLREVAPGRFTGKFETHDDDLGSDVVVDVEDGKGLVSASAPPGVNEDEVFSSVAITPGTGFFMRCTEHIQHFIQYKLSTDPAWQHLQIIFSGPNVPGEGEHKIMQFMREQQFRPDYNPNLRHCIMGQDGDLIMLGLVTHEPNLVLLREQVLFDARRRQQVQQENNLDSYIHNANFEFLHMNILRDYLAYEFETSNVLPGSHFDLEHTIDDFVFLTFLVGNDFLPHMPALDIADEAFDLLMYTYRDQRKEWQKEKKNMKPYLTDAGTIVSGQRLESFLRVIGSHERHYYKYKKSMEQGENERFRRNDMLYGGSTVPSEEEVELKESSDRSRYREMIALSMMESSPPEQKDGFVPVMSQTIPRGFQPKYSEDEKEELQDGLLTRMGNLLEYSVPSEQDGDNKEGELDDQDFKGRYYADKFGFSPFDAEKHTALRKAYMEGLVWNLKYYYQGCVSWEWYYPYHYGPMMSDLVNLDELLDQVSFEDKVGEPLKPFEQLMACLPPSYAHLLPKPFQWFMTDPSSPIAEFYPRSFTVDMNGKRWPWEAVALLPFINSERLLNAARSVSPDELEPDELERNQADETVVLSHDASTQRSLTAVGDGALFGTLETCTARMVPFESSSWTENVQEAPLFRPRLVRGVEIPLPGLPTLRDGSVQSMWRKRIRVNVHGSQSRYKTACLELYDSLPEVLPIQSLASHLIGTPVYINYPHLIEAFVTAVSDSKGIIRGRDELKLWSSKEAIERKERAKRIILYEVFGEKLTGTGGLTVQASGNRGDSKGEVEVLLYVRPLQGTKTMPDGVLTKTYAKFEVEVPLHVTSWMPVELDERIANVPALLEKDPFHAAHRVITVDSANSMPEHDDLSVAPKANVSGDVRAHSSEVIRRGKTKSVEEPRPALKQVPGTKSLEFTASSSPSASIGVLTTDETISDLASQSVSELSSTDEASKARFTRNELMAMTKVQLKAELKAHGLKVSGNKPELIDRLTDFYSSDVSVPLSEDTVELPLLARGLSTFARPKGGTTRHYSTLLGPVQAAQSSLRNRSSGFSGYRVPSPTYSAKYARVSPRSRLLVTGLVLAASLFSNAGAVEFRSEHGAGLLPHDRFTSTTLSAPDVVSTSVRTSEPESSLPPLEFAHGTTTISFVFQGGIVAAVDSRASLGSFVGSKTTQKALPVNSHILSTMAGGAADCSYLIRKLRAEAALHNLMEGRRMSVARVSRLLSNVLYENRALGLSVGTMVLGYDDEKGSPPKIFYVDNSGVRIEGDLFAVGSGSTFALGILDTERRLDMSVDEAVALGVKAIRHATFRDAYSGGFINVFLITKDGWKCVFTQDLAGLTERLCEKIDETKKRT